MAGLVDTGPLPTAFVVRSVLKRGFDVGAALIAIVALAPLLAVIALAVWVDSGGPVFFRQRRTGLHGAAFRIFKFRTMHVCEDEQSIRQAQRGDSRVTRVGNILRRSSLDELPQLFNVVGGSMSLVGPRPHALAHDDLFEAAVPGYRQRFASRPGITGLAQVAGFRGEVRSPRDLQQRVACDLRYIEEWSFALDLRILVKTAAVVFFQREAY